MLISNTAANAAPGPTSAGAGQDDVEVAELRPPVAETSRSSWPPGVRSPHIRSVGGTQMRYRISWSRRAVGAMLGVFGLSLAAAIPLGTTSSEGHNPNLSEAATKSSVV